MSSTGIFQHSLSCHIFYFPPFFFPKISDTKTIHKIYWALNSQTSSSTAEETTWGLTLLLPTYIYRIRHFHQNKSRFLSRPYHLRASRMHQNNRSYLHILLFVPVLNLNETKRPPLTKINIGSDSL